MDDQEAMTWWLTQAYTNCPDRSEDVTDLATNVMVTGGNMEAEAKKWVKDNNCGGSGAAFDFDMDDKDMADWDGDMDDWDGDMADWDGDMSDWDDDMADWEDEQHEWDCDMKECDENDMEWDEKHNNGEWDDEDMDDSKSWDDMDETDLFGDDECQEECLVEDCPYGEVCVITSCWNPCTKETSCVQDYLQSWESEWEEYDCS